MNKVLSGLYLGNFRDAKDSVQLSENKITHILSIHDNCRPILVDKVYLCIPLSDSPTENISQYFSQCNDFIHNARVNGGNVLVHCLAGVSRSVTIVVAYVMSVTELGWRDSLNVVRGARNCASPNFGFQRQLLEFQHENLQQERQRLQTKHPRSPFPDVEDCSRLLEVNCKWVTTGEFQTSAGEKDESKAAAADGSSNSSDADRSSSSPLTRNADENSQQDRKAIDTALPNPGSGDGSSDNSLSKITTNQDAKQCLSPESKPYSFDDVRGALREVSGKSPTEPEAARM